MKKLLAKNSKKGFSLPLAVALSLFLIIISATMIFLAMQSTSMTSADLNGRQAYLNVRSALEYAQAYYSTQVEDYSTITTEYVIMHDKGGTINNGASITTAESETEKATTYVVVTYTKAQDSNPATLKLSAYSRYSDAMGYRAKMAHLSVTFTVGRSGPNRLTIISGSGVGESVTTTDSITLNVKKPAGMDYELTYYVWTYPDKGEYGDTYAAYEAAGNSPFEYDEKIIKPDSNKVNQLNDSTNSASIKPNAEWALADDDAKKLKQGPNGIMADMGNGWFAGEYFIRSGRVPWFNIIFAKQGSVLAPYNDGSHNGAWNIYDSQVNEIFHLWYLDPGDKNIYFEFFDTKKKEGSVEYYTKYYKGSSWNGADGLRDTVLVYVKNTKTTVHFRMAGFDDFNTKTTIPAANQPIISQVVNTDGNPIEGSSYLNAGGNKQSQNIPMEYEGCGWWVANVETNRTFNITLSFLGITRTAYNLPANTVNDEFWLVYHPEVTDASINVHTSETTALYDLNVDPNSYVTVHAKVANYQKKANPTIGFGDIDLTTSSGRSALLTEVLNASKLSDTAYTEATYKELVKALNGKWEKKDGSGNVTATEYLEDSEHNKLKGAWELLNDDDFIKNQVGPTSFQKVAQADVEYNKARERVSNAVKKLVSRQASGSEITTLNTLITRGDKVVQEQHNSGKYDLGAYYSFVGTNATPGTIVAYAEAKAAIADVKNLTAAEAQELITALRTALTEINANVLQRDSLNRRISTLSKFEHSTAYEEEYVTIFDDALKTAREEVNRKDNYNQVLTDARNALENAYTEMKKHPKNLNMQNLMNLVTQARTLLPAGDDPVLENCTLETYNALKAACEKAENAPGTVTKQSQVTALETELQTAIDNFTVAKPYSTNDKLNSEGKIRLWVQYNTKAGYDFYITRTKTGAVSSDIVPSVSFTEWGRPFDKAANAYSNDQFAYAYYDIDKNEATGFETITVVTEKFDTTVTPSTLVDSKTTAAIKVREISDNNLAISIGDDGTPTVGKMVTVYGLFQGDVHKGKIGTDTLPIGYEYYDIFRYIITDANKDQNFSVVGLKANTDGTTTQYTYAVGKLTAGEYVAYYKKADAAKTSVTCTALNVTDIYPKYGTAATPTGSGDEPQNGGTIAAGDVEIMDVLDYNKDVIYLTDSEWDNVLWGDSSYACFYDNSGNVVGNAWPGYQMSFYIKNASGQDVYFVKPPAGATQVRFTNNSTQQSSKISFTAGTGFAKGDYNKDQTENEKNSDYGYGKKVFNLTTWKADAFENDYIYIKNNYDIANLYIYFFGAAGANFTNYQAVPFPGYKLGANEEFTTADGKKIYRIQPPKGATKFIISNGSISNQSHDTTFTLKTGYCISTTVEGKYKMTTCDVPGISTGGGGTGGGGTGGGGTGGGGTTGGGGGTLDVTGYDEVDVTNVDLPMAYVGGSKVRLENRSYWEVYNAYDGQKKNSSNLSIGSGNLFGGTGGAEGNEDSNGRLGLAKPTAYYDWYEYKLPVANETEYTFALAGMNPDAPTVQTKTINNARGDVWLEQLSNYNGGSGHYQNINLYTFDPETTQIGDTLTVFFRLPTGWTNPKIALNGPFIDVVEPKDLTNQLTYGSNNGIYYMNNISKNSPFITFSATDETGQLHEYKTCLQGGDYNLFVPAQNDSDGHWEEFLSPQMELKRQIELLRSTYYGCNIVSQYDDNGELKDGGMRHYSAGLLSMYSNYSEVKRTNDVDYYITKNVESWSEQDAAVASASISSLLSNYRRLYTEIQEARQYIASPLTNDDMTSQKIHGDGGGHYPEYVTRSVKSRSYTSASITSLRRRLAAAEEVFLASSSTNDQIKSAIEALERSVAGLEVSSEGSIACVLFDAQGNVKKNYTYKLHYQIKNAEGNLVDAAPAAVKEYNPERYPIIFLTSADIGGGSEIYNVQFEEYNNVGESKMLGTTKSVMKMDEAWVYVDTKDNPYWSVNTASDYREINADIFVQDAADETQEYHMEVSTPASAGQPEVYKSMTLLFTKDASVKLFNGVNYTIKAGSYFFENKDCHDDTKDVLGNYVSPVYGGTMNLFSQSAANYFTKEANWGDYVVGEKDLNGKSVTRVSSASDWHDGTTFLTGDHTVVGAHVNLNVDKGEMTTYAPYYSFATTEGMSFRWSSEAPLYTSTEVRMTASEYTFAMMGVLDGTQKNTRNPHFYLYCSDPNAKSMKVNFRTDVYVKYYDNMGVLHYYAIREGLYVIEKADSTQQYIANLYDETYWKGMENVTYIGHGTANDGGSSNSGSLVNGKYS